MTGGDLGGLVLERLNRWLTHRLDREHAVGHSFFLQPAYQPLNSGNLTKVWRLDVQPLLEEYFFGDPESLAEAADVWEKALTEGSEEFDEPGAADVD